MTGNPFWDGLASVMIGLVLGFLAVVLLYESKSLLIGESADPLLIEAIRERAAAHAGIVTVHEVLTVHSAPDMVTVIISADFEDAILAREVERIVCQIETEIAARFPVVARVYVRPLDSAAVESALAAPPASE
jgi:divalent metal cation (Fe/Co/Zn/Cd) transporter